MSGRREKTVRAACLVELTYSSVSAGEVLNCMVVRLPLAGLGQFTGHNFITSRRGKEGGSTNPHAYDQIQ